jgi:phospholipase C
LAKYKELPSNFKKLNDAEIAQVNADPLRSPLISKQEKGIRPSSALPYELYADGMVAGSHFELHMTAADKVHGKKSMGSPFNVYLRNTRTNGGAKKYGDDKSNMLIATYTVKAGDTLRQAFPMVLFANGRYEIDVVAPNGFYRSFRGNSAAHGLIVHTAYESKSSSQTGKVDVKLHNTTKTPMTVEVGDNAYKTGKQTVQIAAATEMFVVLDLSKHYGWYDFTVKQAGSKTESRYAGRVETGRSS